MRKIVDDSDYNFHHRLMEKIFVRNDEIDFQYGIYLHCFYVVEKMGSFYLVLARLCVKIGVFVLVFVVFGPMT